MANTQLLSEQLDAPRRDHVEMAIKAESDRTNAILGITRTDED